MSYTPPNGDNITFDFTESGYTAPAGDNVVFEFGAPSSVDAPPAKFFIQGLGSVRAEIVVLVPPAKFNYQGYGKGVLEVLIKAPAARFNHQAIASIAYTVAILAPPAKFYHQGLVEYVDSYKPPVFLTDFINMTNARRDKAISYDKQYAFDMGPIARSDITQGLAARVWRARIDVYDVYLAISDEDASWWADEFKEFTLPHNPVYSADLTFDQNGRPFMCWEYNNEVWIYWYDPVAEAMSIDYVCNGRTPRARLDSRSRHQIPDSDIYLFYLDDSADMMKYRIQRDRYNTAYNAPLLESVQNLYLEVLAMANNWRLYIWASEYLPENEGTHKPAYHLVWRHSATYPYYFIEECEVGLDTILSGAHAGFYSRFSDEKTYIDKDSILSITRRLAMEFATLSDEEVHIDEDDILSISIRTAILSASMYEDDKALVNEDEILAASIRIAILHVSILDEHVMIDTDEITSIYKAVV